MKEEAYPVCTSAACRTRAPALIITSIGIGIVAGLMVESVLGLATPIALGFLLAGACCARRRIKAGRPLPFGRTALFTAAALFMVGGIAAVTYTDIVAPGYAVDTVVVGGLWLVGGTAAALGFLALCALVRLLRPRSGHLYGVAAE